MNPADHLLRIADRTITLQDLCDGELFTLDPDTTLADAHTMLSERGFDIAPVAGPRLDTYVRRVDMVDGSRTVGDIARSIPAEDLVTAGLPLADAIELLAHREWVFVMRREGVYDIFTRADLQQPIVSVVLLGLIVTIEAALSFLIEEIAGPGWFDQLSDGRKASVEDVYVHRKKMNAETTLMDCLFLSDKVNIARRLTPIREAVGVESASNFKELGEKIIGLRNPLAHGGSILHAAPNPEDAIARFSLVRATATRLWECVDAYPDSR